MKIIILTLLILLFINFTNSQSNPIKIAVISTEKPNDLGYNFQVNDAKVAVEKYFNLSNIFYYSAIDKTKSEQFIRDLCEDGFKIILVPTLDYTTQAKKVATSYPNVQFLVRGNNTVTNNVIHVNYNFVGANYITGYFAGLVTKTNVIGYIQPGPKSMNNYPGHAFYYGAKNANPNVTMYWYTTGSWSNPEVSGGATKKLMEEYNVDIFGQTQDDMTVSITAVDQGHIGMGTNGFDQQKIFGDKISFSYILNWTDCFKDFITNVMAYPDGNWPGRSNGYGNFDNTFMPVTFGRKVTPEIKQKVDDHIVYFMNLGLLKAPFYCDDANKYIFSETLLNSDGCILPAQFQNMTDPLPGMTWLGNYSIPITLREVPKSFTYGFVIASGVLIFLSLILELIIWLNKNRSVIRSASPVFCELIVLGGIIVYIGIILWTIPPTNALCNARYWLVSIGFTILIGSLVVKNFRIWLIFDNPELKTIKITNYQLFPWVGGLILINVVLMAAVSGAGDLSVIDAMGIDDLGKYEYMQKCQMVNGSKGTIPLYILLGYFAVLLLIGVFVSWKIRIVDIAEFNESKPIANTLYAISFSLFVIVSLVASPQYYIDQQMILCIAGLFMTTAALGIIFIPKLYALATRQQTKNSQSSLYTKKKSTIASARTSNSKNQSDSKDSQNQNHNPMQSEFTDDSDLSEVDQKLPESGQTLSNNRVFELGSGMSAIALGSDFTSDSDPNSIDNNNNNNNV
ncbi:G-protein-coupled receptor family 3 [Tieghemostelium lacteum]|uniref:G-protein-coupled receptor family 3 n=1 Tax=Tieghemostelium lacteum TaxID=361077 RepID=A0A152A9Q5_TIELA|nr:G-protein-coupled receptor family 3 [Tieghemostelium lacteum]|eukprot:KYR02865.1 G-protein-coupled receptor family 3 [Tieghemostelium lacteum]